jgi:hypothetical protein
MKEVFPSGSPAAVNGIHATLRSVHIDSCLGLHVRLRCRGFEMKQQMGYACVQTAAVKFSRHALSLYTVHIYICISKRIAVPQSH